MNDAETPLIVSLDTNTYESLNFGFGGRVLSRLAELQADGLVEIVMPDVIVREVKRRVTKAAEQAKVTYREQKKCFRILGHDAEVNQKLRSDEFYTDLVAKLHDEFDSFLQNTNATIIETDNVAPSIVFDKYFSVTPPFRKGDKEKEFPDAFALEALERFAVENDSRVLVVSEDNDFVLTCESSERLESRKSINLVIDEVIRHAGDYAVETCHDWVHENQDVLAEEIRQHISRVRSLWCDRLSG